jgi:hypothetical protein
MEGKEVMEGEEERELEGLERQQVEGARPEC